MIPLHSGISSMRLTVPIFVVLACVNFGLGQGPEPPLEEARLTIHTLVREDIFAGWRTNNKQRLERGERNIELLLEKRPDAKADLLAWKGGIALFRAAVALEANRPDDYETQFKRALELFDESRKTNPNSPGANAVIGGSYVLFADRLPKSAQADAWQTCYDCFKTLHKMQAAVIDKLPLHIKGELLAGLTQSALRTGRMDEYEEYLGLIIEKLPKTSYSRMALKWREDPDAAKTENISCKSCHGGGRLSAKLAALDDN